MADTEAPPTPAAAPPLRGRSIDHDADRGSSVRPSWRRRVARWLASGHGAAAAGLLAVIGALIVGLHDARFLVRTVTISGNRMSDAATLQQLAAVQGQPIWQVEPASVAARLQTNPYVASASVSLRLPDQVVIEVREPHHTLTWQAGTQRFAIAPDGRLAPLAASAPISATAIIHDWRTTPPSPDFRIPPAVIEQAQMLLVRMPAEAGLPIASLAWDPLHGLVTIAPDGRVLFWGDSSSLDRQLTIVEALKRQQIAYRVLDLRGRIAAYRTEDDPSLPLTSSTPKSREP
jgi:cell division septal protein FtsQ